MSRREFATALREAVQAGDLAAIDDLLTQADAQGLSDEMTQPETAASARGVSALLRIGGE